MLNVAVGPAFGDCTVRGPWHPAATEGWSVPTVTVTLVATPSVTALGEPLKEVIAACVGVAIRSTRVATTAKATPTASRRVPRHITVLIGFTATSGVSWSLTD